MTMSSMIRVCVICKNSNGSVEVIFDENICKLLIIRLVYDGKFA